MKLPHVTIYSDKLVDFFAGKKAFGSSYLFFIFIRPQSRFYKPIHKHEYVHVLQFYRWFIISLMVFLPIMFMFPLISSILLPLSLFTSTILYNTIKNFKLSFEIEAYMEDIKYGDLKVDDVVYLLNQDLYNFGYDKKFIKEQVLKRVNK